MTYLQEMALKKKNAAPIYKLLTEADLPNKTVWKLDKELMESQAIKQVPRTDASFGPIPPRGESRQSKWRKKHKATVAAYMRAYRAKQKEAK